MIVIFKSIEDALYVNNGVGVLTGLTVCFIYQIGYDLDSVVVPNCTGMTGKLLEFLLSSRSDVYGSLLHSCLMLSLNKALPFISTIHRHIVMHRSPS